MKRIALCALLAGLGACVGPNFHRPDPPRVDRYTAEPLPAETASAPGPGGGAQRFLRETDVPRAWWRLFKSEELNGLVADALRANPNVWSAQAALRQALENAAAQRGTYFPAIEGRFDASRNHDALGVLSPTLASPESYFNLFRPQVVVSYVPDVFGANRRQVESLLAQADTNRHLLDATYLTLTANVVAAAVQEAGLRSQIAATTRVVALAREALAVMRRELELGAIAAGDVFAQEAVLAQWETGLPALNRQLRQNEDALAALTGRLPAQLQPLHLELDDLALPGDLPLGVPSRLVERRPDVRAAEAQLHAATAAVGVSIANLLPQFVITGDIGSSATLMGDLFKAGTGFWSLGASASQTLFAGGTLLHRKRAADAALDQAAALYKAAVLTAFQNVADALHALQSDADAMAAATRFAAASKDSLEVVRAQLELGSVSPLALINAEQSFQQAQVALTQARTNRLGDTAALFQALGGAVQ